MSVVKLGIDGLMAMGFNRVQADALRHILKATGDDTSAPTLPETVAQTAINAAGVADIDADRNDGAGRDNALARSLADIACELVIDRLGAAALLRRLDDIGAELESVALANTNLTRRVADLENGVT